MIDAKMVAAEWTWKTPAMKAMTMAVVRQALKGGEFSAMDLPAQGEESHGGVGIAGSVFRALAEQEIISPVGACTLDGEFHQRRVRNANGNPIGVWRLRNGGLARELLRRHDPEGGEMVQGELF